MKCVTTLSWYFRISQHNGYKLQVVWVQSTANVCSPWQQSKHECLHIPIWMKYVSSCAKTDCCNQWQRLCSITLTDCTDTVRQTSKYDIINLRSDVALLETLIRHHMPQTQTAPAGALAFDHTIIRTGISTDRNNILTLVVVRLSRCVLMKMNADENGRLRLALTMIIISVVWLPQDIVHPWWNPEPEKADLSVSIWLLNENIVKMEDTLALSPVVIEVCENSISCLIRFRSGIPCV